MNKKTFVIIILIVILGGLIFFIAKLFRKPKDSLGNFKTEVSLVELEKEYIDSVTRVMKTYFEGKKLINLTDLQNTALKTEQEKWIDLILKTKNDLLKLKVPAKYKDLHLDLVISFNFLEEGVKGNEEKLKEGEKKLDKIIEQYPWLR